MRLLAALAVRIPAPDCCPHVDLDDDGPDTAFLPADTTNHEHRGSNR